MQAPDHRSGAYYVTARDGCRYSFLAGPFRYHRRALGLVWAANRIVGELDRSGALGSHVRGRTAFWGFGTARLPLASGLPVGKINDRLHVKPDLPRHLLLP
jgi:hypothetical protein